MQPSSVTPHFTFENYKFISSNVSSLSRESGNLADARGSGRGQLAVGSLVTSSWQRETTTVAFIFVFYALTLNIIFTLQLCYDKQPQNTHAKMVYTRKVFLKEYFHFKFCYIL